MAGFRELSREQVRDRVKLLLSVRPATAKELFLSLGVGQQRVSDALKDLEAKIIGLKPPPGKGRSSPIYALKDYEPGKSCETIIPANDPFRLVTA